MARVTSKYDMTVTPEERRRRVTNRARAKRGLPPVERKFTAEGRETTLPEDTESAVAPAFQAVGGALGGAGATMLDAVSGAVKEAVGGVLGGAQGNPMQTMLEQQRTILSKLEALQKSVDELKNQPGLWGD